jgi:hypothetical protein
MIDNIFNSLSVWANLLGALSGVILSIYIGLISLIFNERKQITIEEDRLRKQLERMGLSNQIDNNISFSDFITSNEILKEIVNLVKNDALIVTISINSLNEYYYQYSIIKEKSIENKPDSKLLTHFTIDNFKHLEGLYGNYIRSNKILHKYLSFEIPLRIISLLSLFAIGSLVTASIFGLFTLEIFSFIFFLLSLAILLELVIFVFKYIRVTVLSEIDSPKIPSYSYNITRYLIYTVFIIVLSIIIGYTNNQKVITDKNPIKNNSTDSIPIIDSAAEKKDTITSKPSFDKLKRIEQKKDSNSLIPIVDTLDIKKEESFNNE